MDKLAAAGMSCTEAHSSTAVNERARQRGADTTISAYDSHDFILFLIIHNSIFARMWFNTSCRARK